VRYLRNPYLEEGENIGYTPQELRKKGNKQIYRCFQFDKSLRKLPQKSSHEGIEGAKQGGENKIDSRGFGVQFGKRGFQKPSEGLIEEKNGKKSQGHVPVIKMKAKHNRYNGGKEKRKRSWKEGGLQF